MSRVDAYESITNRVIELIETHGSGWTKPWRDTGLGGAAISVTTGDCYRGINRLLLWLSPYSDSRWGTYKAWQAKGANVRKGEKGTQILFFKPLVIKQDDGTEKQIPLAKIYTVFNAEQVEGCPELPQAEPLTPTELIDNAEQFVRGVGANINLGGDNACYIPSLDQIKVPHPDQFDATESYYGTVLHELVHWTGHKSRTDRNIANSYGSADYAFEELVAELGATFLCADLGVEQEPREDHAQYLASWLRVLRDDKRAIVKAAKLAQEAADFLHGAQDQQQAEAA